MHLYYTVSFILYLFPEHLLATITDVVRHRQQPTAEKGVDLPDSTFLSTKNLLDVNSQIAVRVDTHPDSMLPPRNSINNNSNRCVFVKRVKGRQVLDLCSMTINF
jgi:hypothetical protein